MRKIKKLALILLMCMSVFLLAGTCQAKDTDFSNDIGVDRFAHFGISYVINDQLKRNAGMNDFWAGFTTLAIGAAKEAWIDDHFDNGDFAADCAGVLFYQVHF